AAFSRDLCGRSDRPRHRALQLPLPRQLARARASTGPRHVVATRDGRTGSVWVQVDGSNEAVARSHTPQGIAVVDSNSTVVRAGVDWVSCAPDHKSNELMPDRGTDRARPQATCGFVVHESMLEHSYRTGDLRGESAPGHECWEQRQRRTNKRAPA